MVTDRVSISEIYSSIQGEGRNVGLPTTFVRLQGCPYRCSWCDSEYTWPFPREHETPIKDILRQVRDLGNEWVCVTGGEPLAQQGVTTLFNSLLDYEFQVECETSGGYPIYPHACKNNGHVGRREDSRYNPRVEWVLDLKCPDSGMEHINDYHNILHLRLQDQVKFVIASQSDFNFAMEKSIDIGIQLGQDIPTILFSPVWGPCDPAELVEWMLGAGTMVRELGIRLSLQQHKVIWPNVSKGV